MDVVAKGQNLDGTVDASQKRRNALLDETVGRALSSKTKGGQYYGMCAFSTWSWLSVSNHLSEPGLRFTHALIVPVAISEGWIYGPGLRAGTYAH
jgi:hypothetical protein